MPQAVDVLNSTLQDLLPKFEELFLEGHPILDQLVKSSGIEKRNGKGPYLEFTVLKGHPGQAKGIRNGNEMINSTRRNSALRGNQYAYRCIYHWDVPRMDLAAVGGENDFAKIIENYPKAALAGYMQAFARQLARGSASSGSDAEGTELDGFLTLNGQQSYNPNGSLRSGVFQFLPVGLQTNTNFGIPMSGAVTAPTPGWEHQFSDINNFSTSGISTLRQLMTRANNQGGILENKGVDLLFSDEGTYHNALDTLEGRSVVNDDMKSLSMKYNNRKGFPFEGATLWWEPEIDLADTTSFSGVALDGVCYGLNTSTWAMFMLGNNAKMAGGKGFFELDTPVRTPNQDSWHYEIISYFNLYCTSLRHNLAMTGGAIL